MVIDVLNQIEAHVYKILTLEGLNKEDYKVALQQVQSFCSGAIAAYQEEIDNVVEFNKIKQGILDAARGKR
jgi:hypothetical protein